MRKVYAVLLTIMLACIGCEWHFTASAEDSERDFIVERYDRIESLYLTTGDFSALQQMNIGYPQQTRMLIEDVLKIGEVNDPEINSKFLNFYQDTILQSLIISVEHEFANMDDINDELRSSFERLCKMLPGLELPVVYAQIGSLDQSIIIGNGILGISLDKYLGSDYPLYLREDYGYTDSQRRLMSRQYIAPDCIGFYLLSLYPMPHDRKLSQVERDLHIGKVQWVVNRATGKKVFNTVFTRTIDRYMKKHPKVTIDQLLKNNNYKEFR